MTKSTQTNELRQPFDAGLDDLKVANDKRVQREGGYRNIELYDIEPRNHLLSIVTEILFRLEVMKKQTFEIGYLLYYAENISEHHGDEFYSDLIAPYLPFDDTIAMNHIKFYEACMGDPEISKKLSGLSSYNISNEDFDNRLENALNFYIRGEEYRLQSESLNVIARCAEGEIKTNSREIKDLIQEYKLTKERLDSLEEIVKSLDSECSVDFEECPF